MAGFPIQAVAEVTLPRLVHGIPHRSNAVLAGLVNLRGQVQLCISLHGLLGVTAPESPSRLVVLRDPDRAETWAFAADRSWESGECCAAVARAFPRPSSIRSWGSARRSCRGMNEASACLTNKGFSQRLESQALSGDLSGFSLMELFRMEAEGPPPRSQPAWCRSRALPQRRK